MAFATNINIRLFGFLRLKRNILEFMLQPFLS